MADPLQQPFEGKDNAVDEPLDTDKDDIDEPLQSSTPPQPDDQPMQSSANQANAEISSSDEDVSPPRSDRRRRSTRRRRGVERSSHVGNSSHAGYTSHEVTSFPPSSSTLPAGLTLEEICEKYPNHLNREHLRPFIRGNWSARRIWEEMDSSARRNTSASRPWNYLEHRLNKERRRMGEEREYAQDQQGGTQQQPNSFLAGLAGNPSGQPTSFPLLSGNQNQPPFEFDPRRYPQGQQSGTQQPSSGPAGGSMAPPSFPTSIGNQNQADVEAALAQFRALFRAEIAEQRLILSDILAAEDLTWRFRSQREQNGLVEQEWLRRIRRLERTFARDHDLDAHGLDIPQATVEQMLRRLNVLVQMRTQAATPSPNGTSVQTVTPASNPRLMAFQQQLWVLEGWTIAWRAELRERGGNTLGARGTEPLRSIFSGGAVRGARPFATGTPGQSRQPHSIVPASAPSHGYAGYTPTPSNAPPRPAYAPSYGYAGYTPTTSNAPPPAHASSQGYVTGDTPVQGNATVPSSSSAVGSAPSQESNNSGRLSHRNDPTLPQMPRTPDESSFLEVEDSSNAPANQEDSDTKNAQSDAADPETTSDENFSYQAFLENDDVPGDDWVGEAFKKEKSS